LNHGRDARATIGSRNAAAYCQLGATPQVTIGQT
jgi:hypothetical protein